MWWLGSGETTWLQRHIPTAPELPHLFITKNKSRFVVRYTLKLILEQKLVQEAACSFSVCPCLWVLRNGCFYIPKQTDLINQITSLVCFFILRITFRGITCHDICSCQLAGVPWNITRKYFRVLCSEDRDSVRRRSRSHCSVSVLRMCFNHFNSWRVRLPSGWSAVLPATWMYESSAAKYVLTFLKTMTHHYGESWEKSPYSYLLISFYSMETEMSTEGNVFRSREVGGKKKIKAPKIGCTCFRLCSCCTQNVFLNEVNLFAWFYIYGSLLSTCKISLWQLPHTQGGWTKAVQSGGEKNLTHWQ